MVEGVHQDGVDAGGLQQLQPLTRADDQRRGDVGAQDVQRVRLEGHRHRARAAVTGQRDDLRQHGEVTAVHPVEVADRDDRRPDVRGYLRR